MSSEDDGFKQRLSPFGSAIAVKPSFKAADYAALEAENARLREEISQRVDTSVQLVGVRLELDAALAQLAAIQQAKKEEPLVVATAILGGLFHGGSGPELGDIDVEVCTPHLEKIQHETVDSSDDVFMPLMTVAQHQRITAAMAAEVETWKGMVNEAHEYHSAAMIELARVLGGDVSDEPRLKWVCGIAMDVVSERDALRAEVETWRSNAVMLEQANAGVAQLNGKLRAELAAVKGQENKA